jgi:hypothetical protein
MALSRPLCDDCGVGYFPSFFKVWLTNGLVILDSHMKVTAKSADPAAINAVIASLFG